MAADNQSDSPQADISSEDIITRIKRKDARIGIVGLGQVGLPTALSFFKAGYPIIGYDTNTHLIESLTRGNTAIHEEGIKDLLIKGLSDERILFGSSPRILMDADVIILCVPTPLGPDLDADLSYVRNAITDVASNCLQSRKLLVIESSIPPMTMSGLVVPTIEKITSSKLGRGFLLAFCPERLSPGQALAEISEGIRVVGVIDEDSYKTVAALYSTLNNAKIIRSDFETAEVSKLAENAFRDLNIAFANELAMICHEYEVDVMEVIQIANTHPRVKIHFPGPGVGGPCLPKDPYLLLPKRNISTSLIGKARLVNDSMPSYLVDKVVRHIQNFQPNKMKEAVRIGILGVTYKPDVNDYQNSPSERIVSELTKRRYQNITVHDPICKESFGMRASLDLGSLLRASDCIIISTGHKVYALLHPKDFKQSCIIMDAVRILSKEEFVRSERVHYFAPGLGRYYVP